jgi:methylated-DNA-[protein]-cysteine S-methyltransferase
MSRKRNAAEGKYRSLFGTALGFGGVVASEQGLLEVFLPFSGDNEVQIAAHLATLYPHAAGEDRLTRQGADLLRRYFAGERVKFDLPIDWSGFTPFQTVVYRTVAEIPYGVAESYAAIAARIGRPRAARGIGTAMARNPLPIIIPCHRVVGTSGALTGYSAPGGVMSKKWLLQLEGAAAGGIKK